jgi:DNA-binding transcriptional ArsR family regulator
LANLASKTTSHIYMHLQKEQAIISFHLKVLRMAKLVLSTKKGKEVFYVVNHKRLKQINDLSALLAE